MIPSTALRAAFGIACALSGTLAGAAPLQAQDLQLPIDCRLGENCFVQQYADMEPGPAIRDPFCGQASYDGHSGMDIRLRSMRDLADEVAVVAAADGKVVNVRDGEADRLVFDSAAREAIRGKECGNGVSVAHENGLETLYCHMKQGSVVVKPGDELRAGQKIGSVGASGFVQFPHVHLAVRRNGEEVEPVTGRPLGTGCSDDAGQYASLFTDEISAQLNNDVQFLDYGLTGAALDYDQLVETGAPPAPEADSASLIGWGWVANLQPGDVIGIRITGPDGAVLAEGRSTPQTRHKAAYSYYAGRNAAPEPGDYGLRVSIWRGDAEVLFQEKTVTVAP